MTTIPYDLHKEHTIVIGIDGLGGSGKTTFARELQKMIEGAHLFHLDDFIHSQKIRYNNAYEEWHQYYYLQWRYEYLINELLEPLQKNKEVNRMIEFYEKETDSYSKQEIDIVYGSKVII